MTMKINVINKKRNSRVESYVRERLELVVGRFADRISHVDVHVVDENGVKGGEDKICTIDIKLIPRGQLHVRAKNQDLYAAIVKAVHRAETVVAKTVDKGHRGHEVRHQHGGVRNIPVELEPTE
jgi:putative sigma-54 modulation protein